MTTCATGPCQQPLKYHLKTIALAPPIEPIEVTGKCGRHQREQAVPLSQTWVGLGWSINASHSPASCLHRNVRISTRNPEPRLTGTACSTTALWLHSTVPVPVAAAAAAAAAHLPFPRRLCEEGGWQCPWFSKEWDLLMPSFPCIPMNQSFLPYCTLQTNFCTTFTRSYFSILIIFDFFSQRVFLCALHLPSSWVRDQVGAGKDSVSCSKTLEQTGWSLLWAWSPATLPCNPEHWQLIWISKCLCCMEYFYPALLFLDFLKRQHVINGFHVCIGNYNISGNLEATCNWWGEKDGHLKYSQVQKKKKKGNYIRGLELAHNKSSTKLSKVNNFAFMSLVCVFFLALESNAGDGDWRRIECSCQWPNPSGGAGLTTLTVGLYSPQQHTMHHIRYSPNTLSPLKSP